MIGHRLRPLEPRDLDLILQWRNEPEIRRYMYTSHIITPQEHHDYFRRVWNDPTTQYFLCVNASDVPVGVVHLYNIDPANRTAFWGFYTSTTAPRGTGSVLGYLALNHAFQDLGLVKVNGEVLAFNKRSLAYHQRLGFRIEGIFREAHKVDDGRVDVVRLALSSDDWLNHQAAHVERLLTGQLREPTPLDVGTRHESHLTIGTEQIRAFVEATGDAEPIYLDRASALRAGFEDVVTPGTLVTTVITRYLRRDYLAPGTVLLSQTQEYLAPVYPNNDLTLQLEITRHVGTSITISSSIHKTADPQTTLVRGTHEALAPKETAET